MIGKYNTNRFGNKTLQCFENYVYPVIETINNLECPWIYIQPDIRYDIKKISTEELKREPNKIITLIGDENYFGFDKIWMFNRKLKKEFNKEVKFGMMYNDTNNKKTKKILNIIKYLKSQGINTDLKGKYKQIIPENSGVLKENEYYNFLEKIKYTINLASNKMQITPRIWDCFINNVVSFSEDFDKGYKVLEKDSYLRVLDVFDLEQKINELEKNNKKYQEIINYQRSLIKKEYINGKFILEKFNNLFNELKQRRNK